MADVTTAQMLPFTIQPVKPDPANPGQFLPASVESGSVVYASSDETVLTVGNLAADQLSGAVLPVAAGTARMTVTADADLGAGVTTITGVSEDVNVTTDPADMASTFTITFGAPVPKS